MILTTLLLVTLAMGSASAGQVLSCVLTKSYRSSTQDKNNEQGYQLTTQNARSLAQVADGDWDPPEGSRVLRLLGINLVKNEVYFRDYFRAPPLLGQSGEPSKNVKMSYRLTYRPEHTIKVYDRPTGNHNNYLEYLGIHEGKPYADFTVSCRPGSVFPIRLAVGNYSKKKPFLMQWEPVTDSSPEIQRYAQLVKLNEAEVFNSTQWKTDAAPPVLKLSEKHLGSVLLSLAMPLSEIERYAAVSQDEKQFFLTGYFRPSHELTRLVLSSTVPVEVDIHVPTLLDENSEYLVHTLKARDGMACQMKLPMDPELLYKVVIVGNFDLEEYHDFTLYQYDPEDDFVGLDTELMIPDCKKEIPMRPVAENTTE